MELQQVKAEDLYNIFTDKAKEDCDLMGIDALNLCEQIISAEEKRIPVHSEIIEENLYLYHLDPPVTLIINDNPRRGYWCGKHARSDYRIFTISTTL